MPAKFPFLPVASHRGETFLMPLLPLDMRIGKPEFVRVLGLVDSGATVNVLPFELGLKLGAPWDAQTTSVRLTGNLAGYEARALVVEAIVAEFAPVRLVFAWTRSNSVPLLLGQVNFFEEFNVSIRRAQRVFEIEPVKVR